MNRMKIKVSLQYLTGLNGIPIRSDNIVVLEYDVLPMIFIRDMSCVTHTKIIENFDGIKKKVHNTHRHKYSAYNEKNDAIEGNAADDDYCCIVTKISIVTNMLLVSWITLGKDNVVIL